MKAGFEPGSMHVFFFFFPSNTLLKVCEVSKGGKHFSMCFDHVNAKQRTHEGKDFNIFTGKSSNMGNFFSPFYVASVI